MKPGKKSLLDRTFPTLIGLAILIGGLTAGVFFLGDITMFAPRATPQTTPKQIKITNLTDSSFSVSFMTDETTTGFVKYGTKPNQLSQQAGDDRDQLAGAVSSYTTHHITVRNLQPQTTYYFTLGTASKAAFDNNGQPFSVTTHQKQSNLSLAQTMYGTVLYPDQRPAEGSIVYVNIENTGELSTLVRSSGTWAVPLSQARTPDGMRQPEVTVQTPMTVFAQGPAISSTATLQTKVGQPQLPVETITLGQNAVAQVQTPTADEEAKGGYADTLAQPEFTSTPSASVRPSATPSASPVVSPTASPTATIRPSATPKPTPSITPIARPATDSAQPVSGSSENTLVLLMFGLTFVSFGGFLYLSVRQE